ncbi:Trs20p [Sugiyamaella lignohabitans]|uniref:Trs20p n=1 Tax=Sugiyamaella lignohabitans TaxID=796027 RepID=A0A167ETF0_9ASCO|nr:Trs20p [Sugiyamaella lignohabitans]ANB14432.1 Trs20p [Sugiyamaella lignohabitans]
MASYYLAIIGTKDCPIYELEFGSYRQSGDGISKFPPEIKELSPFILHSSLDIVEDVQWTTNSLYLKSVDNFYSYMVSAFVTPGSKYTISGANLGVGPKFRLEEPAD